MLAMLHGHRAQARALANPTVSSVTAAAGPEAVVNASSASDVRTEPLISNDAFFDVPASRRPAMQASKRQAVSTRRQMLRVVRATQKDLCLVAHEMTTQWHLPWRTHHFWPQRLRQVAQRWMSGEMGPARRVHFVAFRDLLWSIEDHDTTSDHRKFATFTLLWAHCVLHTARHPDAIDGAETAAALEAVGAYLTVVQARYAGVFAPAASESLACTRQEIVAFARRMRGEAQRQNDVGC